MNLVVPVNLQALRVTPNDASLITKQSDCFSGPTTSFEFLPWRDAGFNEYSGRLSKANISANIINPLSGPVTEQLDAGIHLHWQLPDGLTRGIQQPDGTLEFPAVPNRWLVTRIVQRSGQTQPQTKQWVVESDHLMTEDEYTKTYYPAARRKSVATPVGWTLTPNNDPLRDGGALYDPPWRRLGRVFELHVWQPTASAPGQVRHLDEMVRQANPFVAQGTTSGRLQAVGPSGPAFAAYYPDSRAVFGFHDTFDDLEAGLDKAAFQVSYGIVGWHSHASDDPLQSAGFADALAKATAANTKAPQAQRLDVPHLLAQVVIDRYRWSYDPAAGAPSRCVYGGQLVGLPWDTTNAKPDLDPKFPQCYLAPAAPDPTVRISVGSSVSGAMAALVRHEWTDWVTAAWSPDGSKTPDIDEQIEDNLEFLIDALQLGLLHKVGTSNPLAQLEQALHQSGFGSDQGAHLWAVRGEGSEPDKSGEKRYATPDLVLPADGNDLAGKIDALNVRQRRINALLKTIESCRRQIFVDWYHYISAVSSGQDDRDTNALKEDLKNYISGQIVDLWAKLDAAFGTRTPPSPATGNVPVFFSDAGSYLTLSAGRYAGPSPVSSVAGQIVAAANAILDVLATKGYEKFGLHRVEAPRFFAPQEPTVVATGDGLRPAQRNGTAKYLPCRLSTQLLLVLQTESAGNKASLAAADVLALLTLATPNLSDNTTPEAADTLPLLDDVKALMGEACLLDFTLAPVLAAKLNSGDAALATNLPAAIGAIVQRILDAWQAGAPAGKGPQMPAILADQSAAAGTLQVTLPGRAPQGVGLTAQPGGAWQDPFLPLFLVWEVGYRAFEKGVGTGAPRYDTRFVVDRFQLDENTIDLVFKAPLPAIQGGAASLSGTIPLSSRAAEPLLDQISQYVETYPSENPQLQKAADYLRGKPLLSQALSGVHPALLAREQGLQMPAFNPFYDSEAPATRLGAGTNTLDYGNVLTHFVGWAAAGLSDQMPRAGVGYNPLRSGFVDFVRADVVDVFGRKRSMVAPTTPDLATKIVVSWQMSPPEDASAQINLPPRLAQPSRLLFEWVSATDENVVTNSHPATSPVCGWIVWNYLDNSLALFAPSGRPLGSLGVFGGQTSVTWQSAPGNPARDINADLSDPALAHLKKFAIFVYGKSRDFFDAFKSAIENAHTYILPDHARGEDPFAVFMGRPLALVRSSLRLELAGLPAFDTDLTALRASMAATPGAYDWTRRNTAGLLDVDFPVRLGDRNHLADGLVAYLLDGPNPYDAIFAPAAPDTGDPAVRKPSPDTICLKLRPGIDPPGAPYADAARQTAALQDVGTPPLRTPVTLLMDPRASVSATMGILPVKAIDLPAEVYAPALESIEVAFFTHPVLRGVQGLSLPTPAEDGFHWRWTMAAKKDGVAQPQDQDLLDYNIGDRAHFSFSPQVALEGWLKLVPDPQQKSNEVPTR
jgi:hypothetical protein